MTTTLRPTGPLQQGTDGAKNRAYDVCDNGRPVGSVEIGTDAAFGASAGVLLSLNIDEPSRRRGRGTIAALAAEEVLRGWGCGQVRLSVPEGNEGARRLAAALGYTERSRNMLKDLGPTAPALPDGVVAREMTAEEFAAWRRTSVDTYAQSWIDEGVPAEQAMHKSRADHARNLPDGLDTAGMYFHVLVAGDTVAGHVWVSVSEDGDGEATGFVFDVEVNEEYRGRGHGRALMQEAEHITLAAGARRLGLHVFAANTPALRLYESLGYRTTRYNLAKAL
ncbi:GNAT family N-acetyltransferase [Streptomyces sp. NBC_01591]|uniref:GNAT family N-acetyltransferase n=1 Tax=Streptomyces sp. NBC_01591 TaxID=2975888 RepID=UPI002DDA1E0C|nr:GNAT family N-acetyltransferase [Streptomyces sp. NBC_01591]WSD67392.1 GNAT family N-acetyltransferase [Streptomyces sp. NBC_01591]